MQRHCSCRGNLLRLFVPKVGGPVYGSLGVVVVVGASVVVVVVAKRHSGGAGRYEN